MVALRTGQRTSTDAIQEARRAAEGEYGRLFRRSALGKLPSLAPASPLEGSATMSTFSRRSLPASSAFPDLLSHASYSHVDCSLHRPMSTAELVNYRSETAHTSPTDLVIEAVAADAPDNGYGGV